jgi:cyclopropane-fatty-acyl-phospholipid synthase
MILMQKMLSGIVRRGRLKVHYPGGSIQVVSGAEAGPDAAFAIRDNRTIRRLLLNPGLAFGEAFMDGDIEPIDCSIYEILDLLVQNMAEREPLAERLMARVRQARRWLDQLNLAPRARRNAAHHYDLDGRLFSLFLDRDRQYSCAYFRTGQETLEEAQELKKRHIAAKLSLDRPGLEVLEIGCGWGGMALTLARDWGARVTGITLSTEQLEVARARAAEAGLSDRVSFELLDYRAWNRPVDRVLSVAMFEAVGLAHYREFFDVIRRSLKEDGVALVHSIGRSEGPGSTNPWLAKYIFPGGYSPALSEVFPAVERSGLWVTDLEILRLHYAMTIDHWRRRFAANRDTILSLHDERLCRMFEFYLAGCELAFRHMGHMNWQMQLTRRVDALPLTRDWMFAAEANAGRSYEGVTGPATSG